MESVFVVRVVVVQDAPQVVQETQQTALVIRIGDLVLDTNLPVFMLGYEIDVGGVRLKFVFDDEIVLWQPVRHVWQLADEEFDRLKYIVHTLAGLARDIVKPGEFHLIQ